MPLANNISGDECNASLDLPQTSLGNISDRRENGFAGGKFSENKTEGKCDYNWLARQKAKTHEGSFFGAA